jgi:ferredoxin
MKVKIDPDACVGQAMCVLAAPGVFKLQDDDGHAYVVCEEVPQDLVQPVLQAERSCPEQAIKTYR